MWITHLFSRNAHQENTLAPVSYAEGADFGAVAASEQRQIPLACPGGISYCPQEGDQLLLVDAAGGSVCAGVITSPGPLQPGELLLGALTITPQGEIRFPGGGVVSGSPQGEILVNGTPLP